MTFGDFIKQHRQSGGWTLRAFCIRYGVDPSNWSKYERGRLPAPADAETLATWAGYLGIIEGSDDWYTFNDLAALERGMLPPDIRSDAELVGMLPILLSGIRGKKPTVKQLNGIIELLRRDG